MKRPEAGDMVYTISDDGTEIIELPIHRVEEGEPHAQTENGDDLFEVVIRENGLDISYDIFWDDAHECWIHNGSEAWMEWDGEEEDDEDL